MSTLKKNIIYQTLYQILAIILPLITAPYVSRVLGATNIGIYSYTYSVASYFSLFAMLGINNYGNRIIAQVRDDSEKLSRTFSSLLTVHGIAALLMILMYLLYCFFVANEYQVYALIQGLYVIGSLFDINWFYFGIEKFKLTVTRNTIIKVITVICIFLFVKQRDDLWIYILILALGSCVSQSMVWIFIRKFTKFTRPRLNELKVHIKPLFILFIPSIAVSLYKVMDKIMLKWLSDTIQVGYYENSEKVINIPQGIIAAVGTVMLPKMSNLVIKKDSLNLKKYMEWSIQGVMFISVGVTFGLAGVAHEFVPVYFGNDFLPCEFLIMGLVASIPFISFANIIRTQYLIPNKYDNVYVVSVIAGAIINLIINGLLIPLYQAMGAVIGTLAAEISVCVIQCVAVRKKLPLGKYLASIALFPIFGIIMFATIKKIGQMCENLFWAIVIEIIIGALMYLGMGGILLLLKQKQQKHKLL